jgi:hypothetical protein
MLLPEKHNFRGGFLWAQKILQAVAATFLKKTYDKRHSMKRWAGERHLVTAPPSPPIPIDARMHLFFLSFHVFQESADRPHA